MRRSHRIALLMGLQRNTRVFEFMGGVLPGGATLTRASAGWRFNSGLSLVSAGNDVPRFTYDRAGSGLLGLLVEPLVTEGVRNNSASGASAGTPGTLGTNWAIAGLGSGITQTVL